MAQVNDPKPAESLAPVFQGAAAAVVKPARRRRKAPPPFSLRLTAEERARLDQDAGTLPLGAYIRSRLFDGPPPPRRGKARRPARDDKLLAQVLGSFGQSRIANNLNQLAHAANCGSLMLTPEGEASLRASCDAVTAIRRHLMTALGLDPGERHDP